MPFFRGYHYHWLQFPSKEFETKCFSIYIVCRVRYFTRNICFNLVIFIKVISRKSHYRELRAFSYLIVGSCSRIHHLLDCHCTRIWIHMEILHHFLITRTRVADDILKQMKVPCQSLMLLLYVHQIYLEDIVNYELPF